MRPSLSTPARWAAVAALAAALSACDFTPTLDIDTPEYEPAAVLRAVLAADSTATVYLGESENPYDRRREGYVYQRPRRPDAVVTLLRDGQPVETLAPRGDECEDYSQPYDPYTQTVPTYPCGPFVGTVPVEAGGTYTVRAEVAGLPDVRGTVTIPMPPTLTAVEEAAEDEDDRRFRVRLTDPAGRGDRYALSILRSYTYASCGDEGCFGSGAERFPTEFETSDPVLLAAARDVFDDGIRFVTFTDETFDGDTWEFTLAAPRGSFQYFGERTEGALTVQLATMVEDVYDIYQITYFGGGEDNPFAEPVNLPSNVEGGYGLVGAVSVAEVTFEALDEPPSGTAGLSAIRTRNRPAKP